MQSRWRERYNLHMLDRERLDFLSEAIVAAGEYALQMQMSVHRSFKNDGSVLTEADTAISRKLIGTIRTLFPDAAVISEEDSVDNPADPEWVFVLDPIDGTDVYSQGLPTFAVSLGILDRDLRPVGAYIAAPRFGIGEERLFVRMDPGSKALVNGRPLEVSGDKDHATQITMGSKGAREMDFSSYEGKIRVLGSTILHILSPVLFPSIEGVVVQKCFAWDIAAAHAVILSEGMDLSDADGTPFRYTEGFVFGKEKLSRILYGGTDAARSELRRVLPPR